MQNGKDGDTGCPSSQYVDGVVCLYIDGGQTHQHEQRQHTEKEVLVTAAPGQDHEDGGDADMTAGEGCRGALTRFMGILHQTVEEAVAVAGHGHCLVVGGEVIVDVGENALCDALWSYCQIIILGSRDGQEDEDDVVDEECREDDELRAVELLIAEEEVEQRHEGNHREIGGIPQVHELAEDGVGDGLREQKGWLTAEEALLIAREQMVEVGEDAVELIGVGIPPRQEQQLCADTAEMGKAAG